MRGNGGLGRPVPGPGRGLQLAPQKVREPCHQERNQFQLANVPGEFGFFSVECSIIERLFFTKMVILILIASHETVGENFVHKGMSRYRT